MVTNGNLRGAERERLDQPGHICDHAIGTENLIGGNGRPRCHANHTHPIIPSPDYPAHQGAVFVGLSGQNVRRIPEGAAAGGQVEVVYQINVAEIKAFVDNGHVDAVTLGGGPGVADIDILP